VLDQLRSPILPESNALVAEVDFTGSAQDVLVEGFGNADGEQKQAGETLSGLLLGLTEHLPHEGTIGRVGVPGLSKVPPWGGQGVLMVRTIGTKPHITQVVVSISTQVKVKRAKVLLQLGEDSRRRLQAGIPTGHILLGGDGELVPRGAIHGAVVEALGTSCWMLFRNVSMVFRVWMRACSRVER